MIDHVLERRFWVPRPRPEVFEFFADPRSLALVHPPRARLRWLAPPPAALAAGAVLDFSVRLLGLPVRWRVMIREFDRPYRFVDVAAARAVCALGAPPPLRGRIRAGGGVGRDGDLGRGSDHLPAAPRRPRPPGAFAGGRPPDRYHLRRPRAPPPQPPEKSLSARPGRALARGQSPVEGPCPPPRRVMPPRAARRRGRPGGGAHARSGG